MVEDEDELDICIYKVNGGVAFRLALDPKYIYVPLTRRCREIRCELCSSHLNSFYVEIIERLKEAGLLRKNYPMLCCTCFEFVISSEEV